MPAPAPNAPTSRPSPLFRMWIPLVAGGVIAALSGISLWGQSIYSMRGAPASGKVVEFHAASSKSKTIVAQVDVTAPGAAPFRWEVEDTFGLLHWEEGATVPLLCAHVHADHLSCVLDDWGDRFGFPVIAFAVGLAVLVLALRPRPASGA